MSFTGLRIGDASRLSKSQVSNGKVFVRTAETWSAGERARAAAGRRGSQGRRQRRRAYATFLDRRDIRSAVDGCATSRASSNSRISKTGTRTGFGTLAQSNSY